MKKKGNAGDVCDLLFTSPIKQMVEGCFFFSQGTIKFTSDHSNNSKASSQLSHYNNVKTSLQTFTAVCVNLVKISAPFTLLQLLQDCVTMYDTQLQQHTPAFHLVEHHR